MPVASFLIICDKFKQLKREAALSVGNSVCRKICTTFIQIVASSTWDLLRIVTKY